MPTVEFVRAKLACLGVLGLALALAACSRKADIVDEPDGGTIGGPKNPLADAGLMDLDAGLDAGDLPACSTRATDLECVGPNDFPCNFAGWIAVIAKACQNRTGCSANGWLSGETDAQGCVSKLQMSEPNAEFAACVITRASAARCPCGVVSASTFLGVGNDGCVEGSRCASGEFPCPLGQTCVNQLCVASPPADAGM